MEDGIYTDVSITDYHANKTHLSATQLKLARKSLKELDWNQRGLITQGEKSHFDFGNAFELALLDKVGFSNSVAIIKDKEFIEQAKTSNPDLVVPRNSKVYKEAVAVFEQENKGKYFIMDEGKESYETIKCMLESCFADKVIQGLIRNTEYQISLFWTDEETGLKLKTRPDICKRKKNVVVNVKTIEDGSPGAFGRELAKYDYPLQACQEMSGCLRTGLMDFIDKYFWLVVEKVPPYNATIYEFGEEDIKWCMDELRYVYNKVSRAKKENFFPGYSDRADNEFGILTANIPLYYKLL